MTDSVVCALRLERADPAVASRDGLHHELVEVEILEPPCVQTAQFVDARRLSRCR
jgi:hypothetical protein